MIHHWSSTGSSRARIRSAPCTCLDYCHCCANHHVTFRGGHGCHWYLIRGVPRYRCASRGSNRCHLIAGPVSQHPLLTSFTKTLVSGWPPYFTPVGIGDDVACSSLLAKKTSIRLEPAPAMLVNPDCQESASPMVSNNPIQRPRRSGLVYVPNATLGGCQEHHALDF